MRPFLFARGLLLDDRGEDQRVLRARQRQIVAALAPQLGEHMGHRAAHPIDQFLAGLAIAVDIGVGQQIALGRVRAGIAVERRRLAHQGHDLGAGQPLGDRQAMLDRLAGGDDLQGLQHADPRREFVFAGFQRRAARRQAGDQAEHQPVADDAIVRQQIADRGDAGTRRDDQGARLGQRTRALGLAVEPVAGGAEHGNDNPGGDRAPGDKTKEGNHARDPPPAA